MFSSDAVMFTITLPVSCASIESVAVPKRAKTLLELAGPTGPGYATLGSLLGIPLFSTDAMYIFASLSQTLPTRLSVWNFSEVPFLMSYH